MFDEGEALVKHQVIVRSAKICFNLPCLFQHYVFDHTLNY